MAFIYDDSKVIFIIRWTRCSHEELLDSSGSPIDPMLAEYQLDFEEYREIYQEAHYPCSICGVPDDYLALIAIHPSPPDQIVTSTPTFNHPHVEHQHQHYYDHVTYDHEVQHYHHGPETTQGLFLANSSSTMSTAAPPFNPPTGPRADRKLQHKVLRPHRPGKTCPEGHPMCHDHYGTDRCHVPWQNCAFARKAIRSSFYAKNVWKGAPEGWNGDHQHCLDGQDLCAVHTRIVEEMGIIVKQ